MSDSVSVFIKYDGPLSMVARALGEIIGCPLDLEATGEQHRYVLRLFRFDIVVFDDHGLVNDCGIAFTDYGFEMDVVSSGLLDADENALYLAIPKITAKQLMTTLSCECIVVENLQKVLHHYRPA